jgi:dTDP-4-amino-4,6-dideoxygalactose transaminase
VSSSFQIPIVDLRAQYAAIRTEVRSAIDEVLDRQQFILGPAVARLERQMAEFLHCRHAIGVASGSDALLLALMALRIGPRDAVITTPFTFFSTVSSITRLGATPLFIDIDSSSFLLSAKGLDEFLAERARVGSDGTVDSRTGLSIKAVLPVHLFGHTADMNCLVELARKYRLNIVEDVAQACGARCQVDGTVKFAGTIGDVGCFSFFPSKNLGSFGDAGLVTTDAPDLSAIVTMLRTHGEASKYHHELIGINSRLDAIQAAVLAIKLNYLEGWCDKRIERARFYDRLFSEANLIGNGVVAIPRATLDKSHVFNNYVIRAERRDGLKHFLAEQGIQSEIYYPVPLHLQKCFAHLGYRSGDFPDSEVAAHQVLALPLYPELASESQQEVVNTICRFYRR